MAEVKIKASHAVREDCIFLVFVSGKEIGGQMDEGIQVVGISEPRHRFVVHSSHLPREYCDLSFVSWVSLHLGVELPRVARVGEMHDRSHGGAYALFNGFGVRVLMPTEACQQLP